MYQSINIDMNRPISCVENEPIERALDLCSKRLQVCFENYYRMLDTIHLETEAIEMCTERPTQLLYYVDHVRQDVCFQFPNGNDAH